MIVKKGHSKVLNASLFTEKSYPPILRENDKSLSTTELMAKWRAETIGKDECYLWQNQTKL